MRNNCQSDVATSVESYVRAMSAFAAIASSNKLSEANHDIFAAYAGPAVGLAAGLRELAGRKRT
jgi:hypothetical protein